MDISGPDDIQTDLKFSPLKFLLHAGSNKICTLIDFQLSV